MRIGAVNYLNSKPLVSGLDGLAPDVRLSFDLPSRLADSLAAGRLDVALIPSVEFFRGPSYRIVSDACVACRGPVLSVKLLFRVPPKNVRRIALDEGSRTSAALTRILLAETCGIQPERTPLPIGCGVDATDADAVLLIGDRAIQAASGEASYCEVWDLGAKWTEWTALPFVFAMWVAAGSVDTGAVANVLEAARDRGIRQLDEIAAAESQVLNVPCELAIEYLRENLHFTIGRDERAGLGKFYDLCVAHELAPPGLENVIEHAGKKSAIKSAGGL